MTQTHDLTLGNITVTIRSDGTFELPRAYFPNLPESDPSPETIQIGANLWEVKTGERHVLVDTGAGQALKQMFPETGAALEGIEAASVTDIILTHMHADHIGGLLGDDPFPNAKIHVSKAEWDFWSSPALIETAPEEMHPMIQLVQSITGPLSDRLVLHEGEVDLGDGITLLPLPGHTPGHMGVRLVDGGDSLTLIGDAVIAQDIQFATPQVSYLLDVAPEAAVATRVALLERLAESGDLFAATHLSFPGVGRVRRAANGFAYDPA